MCFRPTGCGGTRPFLISELYRRASPGVDWTPWSSHPSNWMALCSLLAWDQAFLTAVDCLLVGIISSLVVKWPPLGSRDSFLLQ